MWECLTRSTWVERTGWVLVHSLWQFALLAILAIVLQRAWERGSDAVPGIVGRHVRHGAYAGGDLVLLWSPDAPALAVKSDPIETPDGVPVLSSQHRGDTAPMTTLPAEPSAEVAVAPQAEPSRSQPVPIGASFSWSLLKNRVQPWLAEIVLVWFAGVFVVAFRPLFSWCMVRRLRTVGVSPVGRQLHEALELLAKKLKAARAVDVLQSTLVKTPVVVGYFRPVVLLPLCVATGLPAAQLELILAHELAHICRHDYLVNLLQTLVETLFFYHPAVWWLSRQIRNERRELLRRRGDGDRGQPCRLWPCPAGDRRVAGIRDHALFGGTRRIAVGADSANRRV